MVLSRSCYFRKKNLLKTNRVFFSKLYTLICIQNILRLTGLCDFITVLKAIRAQPLPENKILKLMKITHEHDHRYLQ